MSNSKSNTQNAFVQTILEHLSNWPAEESNLITMQVLSKVSHHPTIKEWPRLEWENFSDAIIAQQKLIQKLKNLVLCMEPELLNQIYPLPNSSNCG